MLLRSSLLVLSLAGSAVPAFAQTGEAAALARIREEGLQRSQAMEHVIWLSDVYGPRLTGSPTMDQAAEWAMAQLREWGVQNVRQERFAFGKGWSLERFSAHMLEPQVQPIIGLPKSWTAGTGGPVIADVAYAPILSEADFDRYRGTLRGKIVLTQPAREVRLLDGRIVLRMNEQEIAEARAMPPAPQPRQGGARNAETPRRPGNQQIAEFYRTEGVIALLDRGSDSDESAGGSELSWRTQRTDGGTIFVGSGGSRGADAGTGLPAVLLAVEHYNRMVRILERGVPVKMELDVRTRFHDETQPNAFNILGEIPGTDPLVKDEVVMIGAHFDSHHGGTGATDNAAGSAAMMEAMRILLATGVQPRRTIRIALWGAEEQGLIGSRHHARTHYGDSIAREKFSAYYNIDNGTGRIRGVWLQRNEAVRPVFEPWVALLRDLGVEILGPRSVSGTDHTAFDALGLPAFQFVQERLEYNSRTHHSNMDVVDRVQREDVERMAVIVATFAYLTAQRDERLPRKPASND